MSGFFIRIYDYFARRRLLFWCVLVVTVAAMAFLALRVRYDERITSFFPDDEGKSTLVFENMKIKDRIVVLFSASDTLAGVDPSRLVECGEVFEKEFSERIDPDYVESMMSTVDGGDIDGVASYVYDNLPFFMTDADYERLDSLFAAAGGVQERMRYNYSMILSPIGIGIRNSLLRDPLGMGGEAMARLQDMAVVDSYEIYEGHIFSPDMTTMMMVISPSHGMGDTGSNATLIDAIEQAAETVAGQGFADVLVEYVGGPSYAVYNARQIKRDTMLTLSIALTLIVAFILFAFRNRWAVLLIMTPVVFGALFALAMIGLLGGGSISAIAIGAGAAVLGIALSYSIHVLSHNNHVQDPRHVIKELAYPLTVGSFTTIGAFVGLMFTQSQLLRDFGLFSALTLVGTTVYCLVFLPHFLRRSHPKPPGRFLRWVEKINDYHYDRNKWLVGGILALVVVCCFFYNKVSFDSDMMNLNYMPRHLKQAEDRLRAVFGNDAPQIFVSTGSDRDAAYEAYKRTNRRLDSLAAAGVIDGYSSAESFLISPSEQAARIEKWNAYWSDGRKEAVIDDVEAAAAGAGFSAGAFSRFGGDMHREYSVTAAAGAAESLPSLFDGWMTASEGIVMYMTQVKVSSERKEQTYRHFLGDPDVVVVDRGYFANQMAKTVNDDFSWILYFSSILIFVALLISYGRIELALMAFLPMFLSWIIILGLMAIFGIEFNIVNIILSTFIFGIGDDFSIFIMDGLLVDYRTGKKLLPAHKTAIFFSAFTVIVGIGVLILAKHPALHSLALISIFGIIAVVLVAFAIQPVIFRLFISSQTAKGGFPYTLMGLLNTLYAFVYFMIGCFVLQAVVLVLAIMPVGLRKKKLWFHTAVNRATRVFLSTMFTTKRVGIDPHNEDFSRPAVIIANHQSFIDILVLLSLHPKLIMVTNSWVWNSPFFGRLVRYGDFYHTAEGYEKLAATLKPMVDDGYSIAVFPEGTRSADRNIGRFHKGAFYLAEKLGLDILPVALYGNGLISSKRQPFYIKKGLIVSKILERISPADERFGKGYAERTKSIARWFRQRYDELFEEYNRTVNPYFRDALIKNYIYKGPVLEWYMRVKVRMERSYRFFDELIPRDASVVDIGCGYGPLSYMLSMLSPRRKVLGIDYDEEKIEVAEHNFARTDAVSFVCADALEYELPQADFFVLNDVLHYFDYGAQETLLERCFSRMNDGGMVVVRDGDSSAQERHKATERTEKWSVSIIGFNKAQGELCFTSTERLEAVAARHGFELRTAASDAKTSNTIYIITRPEAK